MRVAYRKPPPKKDRKPPLTLFGASLGVRLACVRASWTRQGGRVPKRGRDWPRSPRGDWGGARRSQLPFTAAVHTPRSSFHSQSARWLSGTLFACAEQSASPASSLIARARPRLIARSVALRAQRASVRSLHAHTAPPSHTEYIESAKVGAFFHGARGHFCISVLPNTHAA